MVAVAHLKAVVAMVDHSETRAGLLDSESCHWSCSGTPHCYRSRSSCCSRSDPRAPHPGSRSSTLVVLVVEYIEGFVGHIDCRETSCRTSSSSSHSCCRLLGFGQQTWVLCLHWVVNPPGCSGLARGRYNGAGAGPCRSCQINLKLCLLSIQDERTTKLTFGQSSCGK